MSDENMQSLFTKRGNEISQTEGSEDLAVTLFREYLMLHDPATGQVPTGMHAREVAFLQRQIRPAFKGLSLIHTTGWNSVGPNNTGGRTRAVQVDIANESNLLIATVAGGIWRSTDRGLSWSRSTAPNQLKDNTCLIQDHRPGKTNIWYAGTGEVLSTTFRRDEVFPTSGHTVDVGNGIYKSTDSGKTWFALPSTVDATPITPDSAFDEVWNIVVDNSQSSEDVVYAAGLGAIERSTDGGTTWTHVLGDPISLSACNDVEISSNGVIYAYLSNQAFGSGSPSQAGVWRSQDGVHWTKITPSGWPFGGRMKIAIAPSDENVVYIAGETGSGAELWKYTYISGDGTGSGGSWENRSANLPSEQLGNDGTNLQGGYNVTLKVFPTNENLLFFGATNLFRSPSAFKNANDWDWIGGYYRPYIEGNMDSTQTYPNHHEDQHDVAFVPSNPEIMYSVNDQGIFVTNNDTARASAVRPIEWKSLNNGVVASLPYIVALDHATQDQTIVGGFQDQASWITTGTGPWKQIGVGDGCYCAIADNKTNIYVSSQHGEIKQYHVDANLNPIDSFSRWPSGINQPQFIDPWMLDPMNTDEMYYVANDSLWRNIHLAPGSGYWQPMGACAIKNGTYITALGMSHVPEHRLYYGTSDGHLYRVDGANGTAPTPREITGSIFPKNAFICCVAVDPQNADSIVICFSNYHVISIFASNDGGTTWHDASGNLEENPDGSGNGPSVRWVSIVDQNGQTLYLCGTSAGLFSTTDITGPNVQWAQEGAESIGYALVENIDFRQSDGFVAIATQGSGVFSTYVASNPNTVNAQNDGEDSPLMVWPNPAETNVHITFSLPSPSIYTLAVIDETGKILKRLHGTASGDISKDIDCSQFPNGTYFAQLKSTGAAFNTRFILKH